MLLDLRPGDVARVKAMVANGADPLDAEQEVFGASQYQVGAYLLGLWGFNTAVVEAVAFLGRPSSVPVVDFNIVGVVHLARVLAGSTPIYALPEKGESIGRLRLDRDYLNHVGKVGCLEKWSEEALLEAKR